MQKVPLKAQEKLPNPVPQAKAESLSYPVTLQVGLPEPGDPPLAVELHLFEGDQPVDCWFSSPEKPLNPRLVPPRSRSSPARATPPPRSGPARRGRRAGSSAPEGSRVILFGPARRPHPSMTH